eukprot:snap_masked-scaffold_3-processed-gene-12.19-mRNA-1 protein AED:1.00 eAED:1.00 QI:0/0/0/0/1/1/2/0/140
MVKQKNKRRKSPLFLTSYEVFQTFVIRDNNQVLIHENIISKECYQYWLSCRRRTILHPEDSFRRIVISHTRGSDGRSPFEEDVETSLLNKLRNPTLANADPFSVCFQNNQRKRKKYKSWETRYRNLVGFHEKRKRNLALF